MSQQCLLYIVLVAFVDQLPAVSCAASPTLNNELLRKCKQVYVQLTNEYDWPIRIDCLSAIGSGVPLDMAHCNNTDKILYLENSSGDDDEVKVVQAKFPAENGCELKNVSFQSLQFPNRTWIEIVNYDVINSHGLKNISLEFGEAVSLPCQPPDNQGWVTFPPQPPYTSIWRVSTRNPSLNSSLLRRSLLPQLEIPKRKRIKSNRFPSPIKIPRVTFLDPGVYSCEVGKKGKRAFVAHFAICVKKKKSSLPPLLNCPKKVDFISGSMVIISCSVLTNNDAISTKDLEMTWIKSVGKTQTRVCGASNTKNKSFYGRIDCGWSDLNHEVLKCIDYKVYNSSWIKYQLQDQIKFLVRLSIRKTIRKDEGSYDVRIKFKHSWSDFQTIELRYNNMVEMRALRTALIVILAITAFILTIGVFGWRNRIQILLRIRRHFGKIEQDNKEYVANLIYYISADMEAKEMEETKTMTKWTREKLEELRYKFVDYHEKFQPGYFPETVIANIKRCHRSVLILTKAFIKNPISMFIAQQCYVSLLKNETKLLLIMTPEAKRQIMTESGGIYSEELREACKASRVIIWRQATRENRFKSSLEFAFPNFQPPVQDDTM